MHTHRRHRITFSKRVDCPFGCIAKLQFNIEDKKSIGDWILTVEYADHTLRAGGLDRGRSCASVSRVNLLIALPIEQTYFRLDIRVLLHGEISI